MNNFGLGLILNFTDNASAGMTSAARVLDNLSATADRVSVSINGSAMEMYAIAQSMTQVGNVMSSAGQSILGVFTNLGQKVIDTGMTMQGFRMQMKALYGDVEGEQKIKEIQEYAQTSVFEVENLISSVAMMKAVGIEAMDEITTSSGEHTQKLMDYASDLAAMVPNMRNVYGTGVQAALGAFKEYIAEGNALSLKRGAGLDITQLLGEDKGASIEERTRQVADLIEKLNIAGYTVELQNTPMQQLSNISDVFFNVMSQIADSGVFESFCQLLSNASFFLGTLTKDEERFATLTSVLGDVITTLMRPLHKVLNFVIANADAFFEWMEANPFLAKTLMLVVVALGALLLGGGQLLKLSGTVLMFATSIKYLGGMSRVLTVIGTGFKALLGKMLPVVAIAGIMYVAWKNNLFGIRDLVTSIFGQLGNIISLTFDALSDNTLSLENYKLAESLGILPFINALLDLKYHWGFFVEGFKTGIRDVMDMLNNLGFSFGDTGNIMYDLAEGLGEFFGQFFDVSGGTTDAWEKVGNVLAKVLTIAAGLWVIYKIVSAIVSVVSTVVGFAFKVINIGFQVITFFKKIGAFISKGKVVFKVIGTLVSKIGVVFKAIGAIVGAIASALGLPVWAVGLIIAAIVALVALIVVYRDKIWAFLKQVPGWLYNNILVPILNFFINVINFVVGLWVTLVDFIKGVFGPIVSWIWDHIIQPIIDFFKELWGKITDIVSNVVQSIVDFFTSMWDKVTGIVSNIVSNIQEFFAPIVAWFDEHIIQPIVNFFTGMIDSVGDIFGKIKDKICNAFSAAADFIKGIWEGVTDWFGGIWDKITGWAGDITQKGSEVTGLKTIPAAAHGVDNFVGGLLQVNEQGGELINLPSGSTVIPHDKSVTEALEQGIRMGAESMALYATNRNAPAMYSDTAQRAIERNEYNISFAPGSVVVKCANTTDAELEKTADRLLKIIQRKLELKKMAQRNTGVRNPVFA